MQVLIVHAHPGGKTSFNWALTSVAYETLTAGGHGVEISNLYAMNWQPVSDRRNFTTVANPDYYSQQKEEIYAQEHDGVAPEILAELEKLRRADVLIFQFPLWWFSMPAILKGWVDRVFMIGATYGSGRFFETGKFAGKRAMLSITTGANAGAFTADGIHGQIDSFLYPIHHGVFRFTGFDVLPPFLAYGINRGGAEARAEILAAYRQRMRTLFSTAPLPYPSRQTEFDLNTLERKVPSTV